MKKLLIIALLFLNANIAHALGEMEISGGDKRPAFGNLFLPIFTTTVNVTSISPIQSSYIRNGNHVLVTGYFNLDIITGNVDTQFSMQLPIAQKRRINGGAGGVAATSSGTTNTLRIYSIGPDGIQFRGTPSATTNSTWAFTFGYWLHGE